MKTTTDSNERSPESNHSELMISEAWVSGQQRPLCVCKHVTRNLVDVFFGEGWENWARFNVRRIKGKAFPTKIGGMALPDEVFKDVCKQLEAK